MFFIGLLLVDLVESCVNEKRNFKIYNLNFKHILKQNYKEKVVK